LYYLYSFLYNIIVRYRYKYNMALKTLQLKVNFIIEKIIIKGNWYHFSKSALKLFIYIFLIALYIYYSILVKSWITIIGYFYQPTIISIELHCNSIHFYVLFQSFVQYLPLQILTNVQRVDQYNRLYYISWSKT